MIVYSHISFYLLLSIVAIISGCTPSDQHKELRVLEGRYESLLNTDKMFDVDTIKTVSSKLAQKYLDAVKQAPEDERAPEYLFQAAALYEPNYMNPDYAINLYLQLIDQYPQNPLCAEALFRVAYIYHNVLHSLNEAKKFYELFIRKYPEHELVISARSEIDNLGLSPDSLLRMIIPQNGDSL